jgi:hypothetical protein
MTNWKTRLRDADAEASAEMRQADVDRLRNAVLATAREAHAVRPVFLPRAFVMAAGVLLMVCAGMLAGLQNVTREDASRAATAPAADAGAAADQATVAVERQQLQFSTPGGTRIIWVFDSQFEIKGTLP